MTIGLLENTCLYEVLETLDMQVPEACHIWAWTGAVEATCVLIESAHLKLAPSPAQDGPASGRFGLLVAGLADILDTVVVTDKDIASARTTTRRWARENPKRIALAYDDLLHETPAFIPWLDWFKRNVWTEHARRLGGLFDPYFIPQVATILDVGEQDLRDLWLLSTDVTKLERLVRDRSATEAVDVLTRGYVVSALIRGRYHDNVARRANLQIMHHPLRNGVLRPLAGHACQEVQVSNTLAYLSNVLLASAFSQRHAQRMEVWLENLRLVRRASLAGALDLRAKTTDDVALALAVDAARKLDITVHRRALDRTLDAAAGLGVGGLTSFVVQGWEAFAAALGAAGLSTGVSKMIGDPSRRAISVVTKRRRRLRELAKAGPGRIERVWGIRSPTGK